MQELKVRFGKGSRRPNLGMRERLLLLVLALGLPFLAFIGLDTARQYATARERAQNDVLKLAELTAARLDDHLSDVRQLLGTLSHALGAEPSDAARNDSLLHSLGEQVPERIIGIGAWTLDGRAIGSLERSPLNLHAGIAARPVFQEAVRTRQLAVEAPVLSSPGSPWVALFALPLWRNGEVAGVVCASTRLSALQHLLDPREDLPRGAVITLLDAEGVVLGRSLDPERWIGKPMPVGREAIPQRLAAGRGSSEADSFDGVRRVFGFAVTRSVRWLVYVGLPLDAVLAPLRPQIDRSLWLGGAMLLLGLVLAAWVAEQIARPLRQLGADAGVLGAGDLAHRSRVTAGGEVAVLASTLNRMAAALQERSADLQQSQERLRQITDNLPALVSYLDAQQRFRFANRAYKDWLGLEPDALIGLTLADVYGEAAYQAVRPHIEAALGGHAVVYERELSTPGGARHVEVKLVPRFAADGTVQGLYAMILDITERRDATIRLQRSEERLSLALEGSGLALFDWNIPAGRIYHSAQASLMRGGPPQEIVATPAEMQQHIHPDDLAHVLARQQEALRGDTPNYHAEFRVRTLAGARVNPPASGSWLWVRSRGRVVERDEHGRPVRLAGTDADISERKAVEARLRQLAEIDTLTGLPNRALFNDRLGAALERAMHTERPMALMFLDIDHFKRINDTLGHEAGDDVLKAFGRRLSETVRSSDTVARLAGDEFTVILEDLASEHTAAVLAEKLVRVLREPIQCMGHTLVVTASLGVALRRPGEQDGVALLRRADAALYRAKERGRDGFTLIAGDGTFAH